MKTIHVLNGDCLALGFPAEISGECIIWREALIDGPISERNFFENRENFINKNYGIQDPNYSEMVVQEFDKLMQIPEKSHVFLWFENDLFCHINFSFLVSELRSKNCTIYRVGPKPDSIYFDNDDPAELTELFHRAVKLAPHNLEEISNIWKSFQANRTFQASHSLEQILPNLLQLREANNRLQNGVLSNELRDIAREVENFEELFKIFREKYPIYGFGDLQVKNMLEPTNQNF